MCSLVCIESVLGTHEVLPAMAQFVQGVEGPVPLRILSHYQLVSDNID